MANTGNAFNSLSTVTVSQSVTNNGTKVVRNTSNTMDQDAFVKILMSEMANQSPDNPEDATQFVAQMAQFSSVEQMLNLNRTMTFNSASSLIGKGVNINQVDENGNPYMGLVKKVVKNGDNISVYTELFDSNGNPLYQPKLDSKGNPVYDSKGNPVYVTEPVKVQEVDSNGKLVYDSNGNPVYQPELDSKGNVVKDASGNIVYQTIQKPVARVQAFDYTDITGVNDGENVKDTQQDELSKETQQAQQSSTTKS